MHASMGPHGAVGPCQISASAHAPGVCTRRIRLAVCGAMPAALRKSRSVTSSLCRGYKEWSQQMGGSLCRRNKLTTCVQTLSYAPKRPNIPLRHCDVSTRIEQRSPTRREAEIRIVHQNFLDITSRSVASVSVIRPSARSEPAVAPHTVGGVSRVSHKQHLPLQPRSVHSVVVQPSPNRR
jgi:hypothetical protein